MSEGFTFTFHQRTELSGWLLWQFDRVRVSAHTFLQQDEPYARSMSIELTYELLSRTIQTDTVYISVII
jgi:hypothetical protein